MIDKETIEVEVGRKPKRYNFDRVFGEESTQEVVFDNTGKLLDRVFRGQNLSVFACK